MSGSASFVLDSLARFLASSKKGLSKTLKPQPDLLSIFLCFLHIYEFCRAEFPLTKIKGRNIFKKTKPTETLRYFKLHEELTPSFLLQKRKIRE